MTGRERVIAAIERTPLDRIPRYDGFWDDTFTHWQAQGLQLPEPRTMIVEGAVRQIGSPAVSYFDFDITPLYMDVSMRFPTGILADDGEKITVADRCGYTAKKFKDKSSSMHFLSHKVEDEEDWEKYKDRLRLDPTDTARVDSDSYFLHSHEYPTWEGVKEIFAAYRKLGTFLFTVPGRRPGGTTATKQALWI